jgi:hypothetical protein
MRPGHAHTRHRLHHQQEESKNTHHVPSGSQGTHACGTGFPGFSSRSTAFRIRLSLVQGSQDVG